MTWDDIVIKLTSRKFWICAAAFLGSIGTSIAGLATGAQWVTTMGLVCSTLSAAIYAAAEAYTDGKRANANAEVVTAQGYHAVQMAQLDASSPASVEDEKDGE